jgi:N-ethylmaleimide reductase
MGTTVIKSCNLTISETVEIVEHNRKAAAPAKTAGSEVVVLHAENGYLVDHFVQYGSNKRTDE